MQQLQSSESPFSTAILSSAVHWHLHLSKYQCCRILVIYVFLPKSYWYCSKTLQLVLCVLDKSVTWFAAIDGKQNTIKSWRKRATSSESGGIWCVLRETGCSYCFNGLKLQGPEGSTEHWQMSGIGFINDRPVAGVPPRHLTKELDVIRICPIRRDTGLIARWGISGQTNGVKNFVRPAGLWH
jgi:hypothetical protein